MEWEQKVAEFGSSLYIRIPIDLAKFLELTKGSSIHLCDEKGKHGPYVSFWNPEQQEKQKRKKEEVDAFI